ncbi:hypothetical protein GCM10009701_20230 [Mycolicibacterium murale]
MFGGGTGDDLGGIGRGQIGRRGTVHVRGDGDVVELALRGGDGGLGVAHALLAAVEVMLCGDDVIAGGLHVQDRLVHGFLLRLHGGPELGESLVGLGHVGDQGGQAGRRGCGFGVRQGGGAEQQGQRQQRRCAVDGSHATHVSSWFDATGFSRKTGITSHWRHTYNNGYLQNRTSQLSLKKL